VQQTGTSVGPGCDSARWAGPGGPLREGVGMGLGAPSRAAIRAMKLQQTASMDGEAVRLLPAGMGGEMADGLLLPRALSNRRGKNLPL